MQHNETGFFAYIWRFNALVIAGAALLCIVGGGYAIFSAYTDLIQARQITSTVPADATGTEETKPSREEFTFDGADMVNGGEYARIPLYHAENSSYSKSYGSSQINYLFVHKVTNESHWLIKDKNLLFIASIPMMDAPEKLRPEDKKITAFAYSVVEKDTDGDGNLTNKDLITVSLSDAGGTQYKKLIEGIEKVHVLEQVARDTLLVFYQKNGDYFSELYRLSSMQQLSQKKVGLVQPKQ